MKIELNHSSNEESNLFLRCLYARLREHYGKCAWVFMPFKDGANNIIRVGTIDVGLDDRDQDLMIRYSRKGVIKALSLNNPFSPNSKELDNELYDIASAVDIKRLTRFCVSSLLDTAHLSVVNISADSLFIFSDFDGKQRIAVIVSAFDAQDAAYLAGNLINKICDFMSVCLNTYVKAVDISITYEPPVITQSDLYTGDEDWVDDHPMVDGRLALAEDQVQMALDIIAGKSKPEFLAACAHFNNAAYLLKDYSCNQGFLVDAATVLYVSSLEVCSSLFPYDTSSCHECGQKKYSIRKRVLDLIDRYHPEHLKGFIDKYYRGRSKYTYTLVHFHPQETIMACQYLN